MSPVFFLLAATAPAAWGQALLPIAGLTVGAREVQAEVARTPEARSQGLMHRRSLAADHGMLFVFDEDDQHCFWMKNTPLPLSIAFIDAKGRITSIQDMQPYALDTHCPPGPVRYALEMSEGWFKRAGVSVRDTVSPLPPP
ncbi:DUF192 domain-containing protein [Castellaniella sp. GW247-6E4]|uniref:DUF192 domain-containing protein n=1 Tax=Castellaniella sp. GW247-6E4 TaxID=3140380 RepID=UPI003315A2DB